MLVTLNYTIKMTNLEFSSILELFKDDFSFLEADNLIYKVYYL